MAQTVASRVAFFEKFGQGAGSAAPSSCGKRVREVEAITSPGLVRDVKEKLLSPAQSSNEPIEQAWPMHSVATGGRMNCIVS